MATRTIVTEGDDVLLKKCRTVDKFNNRLFELLDDMADTLYESDGVGLAAPQVGKSLRIVIVDGTDLVDDYPELKDFKRVMINPEITEKSEETAEYSEGCLSVPDINCSVIRPKKITVRYFNEKREQVTETFDGFGCRMVEHELDHLEGHMFIDRVSQIRRKLIGGKLRKLETRNFRPRYKIK